MRQHVVQRHELRFDAERRAVAAMAVVGLAKERVKRLGAQVIDMRVSHEHIAGDVVTTVKLLNQIGRGTAARLSEERVELPPHEVAAVKRRELDELRFAPGVAKVLER